MGILQSSYIKKSKTIHIWENTIVNGKYSYWIFQYLLFKSYFGIIGFLSSFFFGFFWLIIILMLTNGFFW